MVKTVYAWGRSIYHRIFATELIRRVVRNTSYLFTATGFATGLGFVNSGLQVRLIGIEGLAIVGVTSQFVSMVNSFTSFRMHELVVKYVGHFSEKDDRERAMAVFKGATLVEISTSFISIGLIWLLAPEAADFFLDDIVSSDKVNWFLFYGTGLIFVNIMFESSTGMLQIFNRFRTIAIINVIQSVVLVSVTASAFILGGDIFSVLLAYLSSKLVGGFGVAFFALREANREWGRRWWFVSLFSLRDYMPELLRFGISTNISGTMSMVVQGSELLWISAFRDTQEAGYFSLALRLANLVLLPVSPLPKAIYPELAREIARRDWASFRRVLRQGSRLAGLYTFISSLGLVALGKWILPIWAGPDSLPAYPALIIILMGLLVANTFFWERQALLALGLPEYATRVNVGVTVLKIVGAFILLPRIGYIGSAVLLTSSYLFGKTLSVVKVRAELKFQEQQAALGA
ncbi:MAG: oligosaccharide flippase family protein [Chloroflexi bacterium]|nr:oligosaccharide flippase family protein [Chloroflexota bacterium]